MSTTTADCVDPRSRWRLPSDTVPRGVAPPACSTPIRSLPTRASARTSSSRRRRSSRARASRSEARCPTRTPRAWSSTTRSVRHRQVLRLRPLSRPARAPTSACSTPSRPTTASMRAPCSARASSSPATTPSSIPGSTRPATSILLAVSGLETNRSDYVARLYLSPFTGLSSSPSRASTRRTWSSAPRGHDRAMRATAPVTARVAYTFTPSIRDRACIDNSRTS